MCCLYQHAFSFVLNVRNVCQRAFYSLREIKTSVNASKCSIRVSLALKRAVGLESINE